MLRYIAIPMGEASGTCVEIIIKTVQSKPFGSFGGIIVTGDRAVFKRVSSDISIPLPFSAFVENEDELKSALEEGEQYIFYNTSHIDMTKFEYGKVSSDTGRASYEALKVAVALNLNQYAFALVTTAISPEALHLAGHKESGLTELLGYFASSSRLMNMLVSEKANIFLLSHRRSVRSAIEKVTQENILDALISIDGLYVSDYFDSSLEIAVGALNPSLGDGIWSGDEEEKAIKPAIDIAKRIGIKVTGPVDVEVLYKNAFKGKYSAILAMQRNEAYAAISDKEMVMITWGLPFMRVGSTEDVGLDLAGKNIAPIDNMKKALDTAVHISDKGVFA